MRLFLSIIVEFNDTNYRGKYSQTFLPFSESNNRNFIQYIPQMVCFKCWIKINFTSETSSICFEIKGMHKRNGNSPKHASKLNRHSHASKTCTQQHETSPTRQNSGFKNSPHSMVNAILPVSPCSNWKRTATGYITLSSGTSRRSRRRCWPAELSTCSGKGYAMWRRPGFNSTFDRASRRRPAHPLATGTYLLGRE